MTMIGFEFPLDGAQQWDGFNEPGIEHFAGSPFRSLGREGTQNATDAAKDGLPTRILIRRLDVPTSSIPDVAGLRKSVSRCQAAAAAEGEKARIFFDEAHKLLQSPKVSVLQFSDNNTKGVRGPCENGRPYFAMMKANGQSKKESATASGSFGIGKFAPFTVSGLRTIFVTTVWEDEDSRLHHYVQGKSVLMSHKEKNKTYRGTGYWGVRENCQPLIGKKDILPEWLRRDDSSPNATGTTLSILGFVPTKNWQNILLASIAESFFRAISHRRLEVEVEGHTVLNADTLPEFFRDEAAVKAIEDQKDEPEIFNNSHFFYRALTSAERKVEETENANLGRFQLHILVGEKLPKKVAVLRNGMLITSELQRLRRFPEFKEFAAVLECMNEKGNALLRAMEPPAHDDFEPERLPVTQQRTARIGLAELATWVRNMLRRHAQDPVAEVTQIDELAEFLGDEQEDNSSGSRSGDENPRGQIKIRARPVPKPKAISSGQEPGSNEGDADGSGNGTESGDGGSGGDNDSDGGNDTGEGGSGPSPGNQDGNNGSGSSASVATLPLRNVRAVVLSASRRRVSFTPGISGDIRVELEDSGADTNRYLPVVDSSVGSVANGKIFLSCLSGKRVSVEVGLDQAFEGTIRVKANAV